ncbi:P-Pant transferase superfamily [Halomonadaceae bacterium LMG 33818]
MQSSVFSPFIQEGDLFLTPLPETAISAIYDTLDTQYSVMLSITCFDLSQYSDADYDRYGINLPTYIERAVKKRRAEYLAARVCARFALQRVGIDALPQSIQGERRPHWPNASVGSITHSDGIAASYATASSYVRSMGLDIEKWIDVNKVERLAPAILTKNELAYWNSLSVAMKSNWLTRIFSAKETLFKLLNPLVGQSFYFHDAEVTEFNSQRNVLTLTLLIHLNHEFVTGYRCNIHYCDMPRWVITHGLIPASV